MDAPAGMDPAANCDVPTTTLTTFLKDGGYKQFPHESAVHRSSGPHGGNVLVYFNPLLDASLKAGDAEHPKCSAAIKELYGSGTTTVTGWAVAVKTAAQSNNGQSWYWYEGSGSGSGSYGNPTCTGCHSAGKDYILTAPLP